MATVGQVALVVLVGPAGLAVRVAPPAMAQLRSFLPGAVHSRIPIAARFWAAVVVVAETPERVGPEVLAVQVVTVAPEEWVWAVDSVGLVDLVGPVGIAVSVAPPVPSATVVSERLESSSTVAVR